MGSIQKVGDDYFIEFYARGLKYQQKIGSDKQAAQKALDTIESQIAKGVDQTVPPDREFERQSSRTIRDAAGWQASNCLRLA